jgi:hypothetical protein
LTVAKVDDMDLNSELPSIADEASTSAEPVELASTDLETAPVGDMPEESKSEEGKPSEETSEKSPKKGRRKDRGDKESKSLALVAAVAAAIGLPVICLALAFLNIVLFCTAFYLIGLGYVPLALWLGRKTNTIYTVFLGCVLAALMTAIYCLWIELAVHYLGDYEAKEAKQGISMNLPADHALVDMRLHV